jgi:hypothetical protein
MRDSMRQVALVPHLCVGEEARKSEANGEISESLVPPLLAGEGVKG